MLPQLKCRLKVLITNALVPTTVAAFLLGSTVVVIGYVRTQVAEIAKEAASKAVDEALAPSSPPIEWKGGKAITPQVKIGDVLTLEYTAKINKQCPADLRAFILDADTDSAVYRFPDAAGGYRRADAMPQTILVKVQVLNPPPGAGLPPLKPGNYVYRSTAIRYCERIVLDFNIPDVPFQIVP